MEINLKGVKATEYADIQTYLCKGNESVEDAIKRVVKSEVVAAKLLEDLKYRRENDERSY